MEESNAGTAAGDVTDRLRAGDPEVLRDLFHRWCRPLFVFLLGMVGDRALAEELTQETFLRACRRLSAVRGESRLSTWLFGIARNVALESLRRRRRAGLRVDLDESQWRRLRDGRQTQEGAIMAAELRDRVHRAVASLPEGQRLVFLLRAVNGLRYEEIAAVAGISPAKLKADLHRARVSMRHKLAPYAGGRMSQPGGGS